MSWRSSGLVDQLGIRICFSGGIGDGSDAGGFGGDGGFGDDSGGRGGDAGGVGGDLGTDLSNDMGGDFSADSYGGDAGLGSNGYGSDRGPGADGYGSEVSDAAYGDDLGMDAVETDAGFGFESTHGLEGRNTESVDDESHAMAGAGDLDIDTGSLNAGDDLSGASTEAGGHLAAGQAEAVSIADDGSGLASDVDDGLAAGSLAASDLSEAALDGTVQQSWSETSDVTTADLTPAGDVESYAPDLDLGLYEDGTDPSLAADTYSTSNVTAVETQDLTSFDAGLEVDEIEAPANLEGNVVPSTLEVVGAHETVPLSEMVVEASAGTVVRDVLLGIGIEEVYDAAKDAVVDAFKNGQAKPDQVDIMGNPNPAVPSLFEADGTPHSQSQAPTAPAAPGSATHDLFSPNPLGTGKENFDREDRHSGS